MIRNTIILLTLTAFCLNGCGPSKLESINKLKAKGDLIVLRIESYKEKNGDYPKTLKEAGIDDIQTPFGPWEYSRENKNEFTLAVGDYSKYYFRIWWRQKEKYWYVDT